MEYSEPRQTESKIVWRELNPYTRTYRGNSVWRLHTTHNIQPTDYLPGNTMHIKIPKMTDSVVIFPDTLRLSFDYEGDAADKYQSYLTAAIIDTLTVHIGTKKVFELEHYADYCIYKSYWMDSQYRSKNMMLQGIESEAVYKNRVLGESGGETAAIVAVALTNKKRYVLPINFELFTEAFCPHSLRDDVILDIKLTNNSNLGLSKYKLKNVTLEYDRVENRELAMECHRKMANHSFYYKQIDNHPSVKSATACSITIPCKYQSLRAVLVLPIPTRTSYDGKYGSTNFNDISVTVDGTSNQIFPAHLASYMTWEEANRYFNPLDKKQLAIDHSEFYTDKKCLLVNFEGITGDVFEIGRDVNQSVVLRFACDTTNIDLKVYTIYDTYINIIDQVVKDVMY